MFNLKESIKKLGYRHEELGPEIILIYNFLLDTEINKILKKINSLTQKDWENHYMQGVIGLAERKYGRADIENLVDEGLIEITQHWKDKNVGLDYEISGPITERINKIFSESDKLIFDGVGTIQRQYDGAELKIHVDNHADPLIEYAVIMYINDDYIDGELIFPKLGLELRPPKKSLIIFPSGENYLHGVRPPGKGPLRYVLPSFVKRVGNYE